MDVKKLDLAVRDYDKSGLDGQSLIGRKFKGGYVVTGEDGYSCEYDNYLCNDDFGRLVDSMSAEQKNRFDEGDGKELAESILFGKPMPPKMASFGSSSRMIYLYSRELPGFEFEKKLKTTISSRKANLDGYFRTEDTVYFVEAKLREPYGQKSKRKIGSSYFDLYGDISRVIKNLKFGETAADFKYKGETVIFDLKQIISHFLGVGNEMLANFRNYKGKKIEFVYLIYNPIKLGPDARLGVIIEHYKKAIEQIEEFNGSGAAGSEPNRSVFKKLFGTVVEYLWRKKRRSYKGVTDEDLSGIISDFHFNLVDHEEYKKMFTEAER